jgi:hypothetical protein
MSSIYSNLLTVLDQQFIFKHRTSSSVKRLTVGFDHKTQENIVTLEYRVKVSDEHEDSLGDDDYSNVGPQMEAVQAERMDRTRRQIIDSWNADLESMLDQYPFLDKYMM